MFTWTTPLLFIADVVLSAADLGITAVVGGLVLIGGVVGLWVATKKAAR